MTSESKEDTEPWIEDKGVEYAYAYDHGGLHGALGLGGYPASVLVDAFGTIVWKGHPAEVSSKMLKEAAKDSLRTPAWEWPEEAAELKTAIASGKLKAAIEAADALDLKEIVPVQKHLRTMVTKRVESLEAKLDDKDVRGALALVESLRESLEGLPELEQVEKTATEIAEDPKLKEILADQAALEEVAARIPTRGGSGDWTEDSLEEAIKSVGKIGKRYKKSAAGRRAEELLQQLEAVQREL